MIRRAPLSRQCRDRVGAEKLTRRTDKGRCTRKNVATCRATYVPHSVAPAVRQDPDGDLEILVSNPIGVFGTHGAVHDRGDPPIAMASGCDSSVLTQLVCPCPITPGLSIAAPHFCNDTETTRAGRRRVTS